MSINGGHAVAASTIIFMNVTTEDIARIASIVFGVVYLAMAVRSHFIEHPWRKKDAKMQASQEEEQ